MYINSVKIDGFKNLSSIDISLDEKLNVFFGKNAQGKTNLIEAIWICSGVRSFRGTKDKDFININGEKFSIDIEFTDKLRKQRISFSSVRSNLKDKAITLNGVKLKTPSKLFGNLNCVVFTPEDLELSKGSPDNRRSFLDLSVAQIKNSYNDVVEKYENVLLQRNAQLKLISMGKSDVSMLDVWNIQLAKLGSYISLLRYNYVKKLGFFTQNLYSRISGGKEKLDLIYSSSVFDKLENRTDYQGEMFNEYLKLLMANIDSDIRSGFTQVGVHRDDLISMINGMNAREFASQGQHRSIALILKLAQAYILAEEREDAPVILLDDILSELDKSRQNFVLSQINGMQVFITCCDRSVTFDFDDKKIPKGNLFFVNEGKIIKR